MIIPIGPEDDRQELYLIERISEGRGAEDFSVKSLMGVRYVPLVKTRAK